MRDNKRWVIKKWWEVFKQAEEAKEVKEVEAADT